MSSIRYCGTWMDHSGYGSANRSFIGALAFAGVDVSTELVTQVGEQANFGWIGAFCESLKDRQIPYKIKIIHLTPDLYPNYMEHGKYHIGHLFWETNHLPQSWVEPCNKMDEIWTASESQAEMIRNSGVTVPVFAFPQPINTSLVGKITDPYVIPNSSGFVFYSIFQWIERKNPKALLQTYWKTFTRKDNVVLVIKTYGVNYGDGEFVRIKEEITAWKRELNLDYYPRVILVKKLMSTSELTRLHLTGNCYVSSSRGEGWGIPAVEAMLQGKPVISPEHIGFAEYLDKQSYYPCKTKLVQTTESPSIPWYTSEQKWLEINDKDLASQMLAVYNGKAKAKTLGQHAQDFVKTHFSYNEVGSKLKARIEEIERIL